MSRKRFRPMMRISDVMTGRASVVTDPEVADFSLPVSFGRVDHVGTDRVVDNLCEIIRDPRQADTLAANANSWYFADNSVADRPKTCVEYYFPRKD